MKTLFDQTESRQNALQLLQQLCKERETREHRVLNLLRSPDSQDHSGWHFNCPSFFNDALDIQQTQRVISGERVIQWTQGSTFSFKKGDVLYDTPDAYKGGPESLKCFKMCLNITESVDVSPAQPDKPRDPGFVQYNILKPNVAGNKLEIVATKDGTQDEFVEFLISGKHRTQ